MKIGIVLDNPRRELDGVLLIAHHLVRRGHSVFVMPMYQQGYDVPWLELDVIIVNYARPNNRDFLATCHELGTSVVVLDNEGSVVPDDRTQTPYGPDAIRANDLGQFIDHYLFWGERQHEHFRRRSPIPEGRLHVTGCPRYDFCHPRWQSTLTYPLSHYVLTNSNFSAVNPLFTGSVEKELKQFLRVGWDEGETRAHLAETTAMLGRYLDTLQALAEANPQRQFLLRPHPFEDSSLYERRFASHDNVRVDGTGSVMRMIRNATCTVHLNCQTAIETLLMGKLPLSIEYINTERSRQRYALPSAVSWPAGNFAQLNDIIQAPEEYLKQMPAAALFQQHIRPLFHENDGLAASRVADIAEIAQRPPKAAVRRLARSVRGAFATATAGRVAQGALCNVIGSRSVAALRAQISPRRRVKHIGCAEVERRLGDIDCAAGVPGGVTVAHAAHPVTNVPLASIVIRPRQGSSDGDRSSVTREP
jgi:surface carbohydrate biosynthesis protein